MRGGIARMTSICSASCGVSAKQTAALATIAWKLTSPSDSPVNATNACTASGSDTITQSSGSSASASQSGVVQNCRRSSARMP